MGRNKNKKYKPKRYDKINKNKEKNQVIASSEQNVPSDRFKSTVVSNTGVSTKKYRITIELLSNLIVSDGDAFGSSVDSDVCYDLYGLPYIPAKRLKGLIREAAFDTSSFVLFDKMKSQGDSDTEFFINDARLIDYDKLMAETKGAIESGNYSAQDVLEQYTSITTQTALEDGVAKDQSLRTIRKINKGICFYVEVEIEDANEKILNELNKSLKALKHMGTSRTRGYGFVKCSCELVDNGKSKPKKKDLKTDETIWRLDYTLTLLSPAIMINGSGNRAVSESYIEGSKMLGAFIRAYSKSYKNESAMKLIDDNIKFSNLYISQGGKRAKPAMKSLVQIKDQKYNNGELTVYNLLEHSPECKETEGKQLKPFNEKYFLGEYSGNSGEILGVDQTIRYHHRRSNDKAKTIDDNTSSFYQIESISKGQEFSGYVLGTNKQIQAFKEVIKNDDVLSIGYSKTAEYGKCRIKYNNQVKLNNASHTASNEKQTYYMHLLSPTIIYNQSGMVTNNATNLEKYFDNKIKVKLDKSFINFKSIGGYNITWKTIKPTLNILDKGTVLVIESNKELPKTGFTGERQAEGFGEFQIYSSAEIAASIVLTKTQNNLGNMDNIGDSDLSNRIKWQKKKTEIVLTAYDNVDRLKGINSTTLSAVIDVLNKGDIYELYREISCISDNTKRKTLKDVFFVLNNDTDINNYNAIFTNYESQLYNGRTAAMTTACWSNDDYRNCDRLKVDNELNVNDNQFNDLAITFYKLLFTLAKYKLRKSSDNQNVDEEGA